MTSWLAWIINGVFDPCCYESLIVQLAYGEVPDGTLVGIVGSGRVPEWCTSRAPGLSQAKGTTSYFSTSGLEGKNVKDRSSLT